MKQVFTVKTNSHLVDLSKPHFFVLNKGLNSGKPLRQACANCFIITTKSERQLEQLFWLCYGIWKSKNFQYYLRGSVIPFITIPDFSKILSKSFEKVLDEQENFDKYVSTIQQLELKQKHYLETIRLIEEAKKIVMSKYIQRH